MSRAASSPAPGLPLICWAAIRPRTLGIALAPVAVGTALAVADGATLNGWVLLATLLSALLIQIGANLHNDAADFERGADGPGRTGPLRITQAGWARAATVRRAALGSFALALLLGIYLVAAGGAFILGIGIASLIAGWSYSGGRWPISHTPFGELFVLVFFGVLAVAGSHWLQSPRFSGVDLLAGLAVGAPAAAVLLVNNFRDLETDLRSGRRTLAAVLGRRFCAPAFAALVFAPAPLLVAIAAMGFPGALPGLLVMPRLPGLVRRFAAVSGPELNGVLAATAQNGCQMGLLMAAGIALSSMF